MSSAADEQREESFKEGLSSGTFLDQADSHLVGCSVLLCFSGKDKGFVKMLHDALAVDDRKIWVDWEDIPPSNDWIRETNRGIDTSDCFIFVLSPDSVKSEFCNMQIDHAVRNGKRIVPVVCRDVDFKIVRKEIAALNWIFFRSDGDDFKAAMKLLQRTLDSDIRHARYHTKLLCTAREWEETEFDKSLLLRGNDLVRAQHWLSASALGKEPKPTTLHLSYITASDTLASSMKRRQLVALFFAFVVAIAIIWPSWGVFFFALVFSHLFVYFAAN